MSDSLEPPHANARSIWTWIAVDPVVMRLAPRIGRNLAITPNLVTYFAGLLAFGSALSFVFGWLALGGILFVIRYHVDCLDGQIARVQGRSSASGAALDISIDVIGISAAMASLCWYLNSQDLIPLWLVVGLMASVTVYNWSLAYRKTLAKSLALSTDGGSGGTIILNLPLLGQWTRWCQRRRMSPFPWAVEVEILAFGMAPLIFPASWMMAVLMVAFSFYLLADVVNLRRIWRLAGILDQGNARVH